MPKHPSHPLDYLFSALSDPTRRDVVLRLNEAGAAPVAALAAAYAMAGPSFTKHLQVLEEAGLIDRTPAGRQRLVSLREDALLPVRDWIDRVVPPAVPAPAAPAAAPAGTAALAKAIALHDELAASMAIITLAVAPRDERAAAPFSPAAHAARRLRALLAPDPVLAAELAEALALYGDLALQIAEAQAGGPVDPLRTTTMPLARSQFKWRQHPLLGELLADPSGQAA